MFEDLANVEIRQPELSICSSQAVCDLCLFCSPRFLISVFTFLFYLAESMG